MGFFSNIAKVVTSPLSIATGIAGGIIGNVLGEDNDDQKKLINSQIKAYKDQTELTRQQLDKTRAAEDIEHRRIQEKQIRSLRSNYRPAGGLLGVGNQATGDMSNQLGG